MEVKHGIISIHPHREQMKQKLKAFSLCISVPIANCFTAQFGQDLSSTSIAFSFPFYYTSSDRYTGGRERRGRNHKFPARTHGRLPVVTLSSAGRARISLKHGLGGPKPDDLVSLPPALILAHTPADVQVGSSSKSRSQAETTREGRGRSHFHAPL
jgi:hypothetical protein